MASEIMTVEKTEIENFQKDGEGSIYQAKKLAAAIVDSESLAAAADMMLESKRRIKIIQERFKDSKTKAKAAHKSICDLENVLVEPYERIEKEILKPAILAFDEAQERERRKREDKAREEERKRVEDERIRRAAEMEKDGDGAAAQELIEAPIFVPATVIPKAEAPKGISYRDNWRFRIVDASLLPREYLMPNEDTIGAIVDALKDETRIPGIEVYNERTVAGRV